MRTKRTVLALTLVVGLIATLVGGATLAFFWDRDAAEPVQFTAGTVLIEADSRVIASQYFDSTERIFVYGVERGRGGDIYEIDVKDGTEYLLYENPNTYGRDWYPNALAFDRANYRLYFASSENTLDFYDFADDSIKPAGTFEHTGGDVQGATFGRGYYWFIPDDTVQLCRVAFNPDGTIDPASRECITMFTPEPGEPDIELRLGDIVIEYVEGIIYGSATGWGSSDAVFFTYNIDDDDFTVVEDADAIDLQLAWGSDGVLYGHRISTRNWYEVDPEAGTKSFAFQGATPYNDLASGYTSYWNPGDCAWAKFRVENAGNKNSYVRAELTGVWQEKVGGVWVLWDQDGAINLDVVELKLCDTDELENDDWLIRRENGKFFVYYKHVLAPGQQAELCLRVCLQGEETCNAYQGKRYELQGVFEAIQTTHGASDERWDWSPE